MDKDSPHMFSAIEKGNYAVCGKLTRNGYITDDITKVECKMCKQIDELNFVRGEN